MKRFLAAVALCGTLTVQADPIIEQDKLLHMTGSMALGLVAATVWPDEPYKAFGAVMAIGLAKELMDRNKPGGKFSSKDLVFDALGAAVGVRVGNWYLSPRYIQYRIEF